MKEKDLVLVDRGSRREATSWEKVDFLIPLFENYWILPRPTEGNILFLKPFKIQLLSSSKLARLSSYPILH